MDCTLMEEGRVRSRLMWGWGWGGSDGLWGSSPGGQWAGGQGNELSAYKLRDDPMEVLGKRDAGI